jgi:ankyrin repeat protein
MLLNAGADVKAKDRAGMTAFDYAKGNAKLRAPEHFNSFLSRLRCCGY